ncbi:nuclear transport factor 2 family protein [Larkinella soli]|uniref:nuclear transport factor 2 family protein n=1 Tax=Larkinella soli TaxID=1770527 RepID=UPI000FFB5F33|nr:nuclear transport factor 2 family protein [Larkinella soli]
MKPSSRNRYAILTVLSLATFILSGNYSKPLPAIPPRFVQDYYRAYSGTPTAARLAPFYDDEVVLEDPTFDFTGPTKQAIFRNFDRANLPNQYEWRINQQITEGSRLVTEGILRARYHGIAYEMRFVNIFHFRNGKIVRQFDYYDNADYFKAVKAWKER